MRTKLGFLRHRYVLLSLIAGALALAAWGLYPRPASAQGAAGDFSRPIRPDQIFSTGPFMLHDGERARIGLLMPGVPRARADAQFFILDSSGMRVFPETNNLLTSGMGPRWTAFFDITYEKAKGVLSVSFQGGIYVGKWEAPSTDGIFIGVLVPAVRRNGMIASPLGTSIQSFNAKGETMTHSHFDSFFDIFVE